VAGATTRELGEMVLKAFPRAGIVSDLPSYATSPHDTQLPGIWFEVGRQPLGAIDLRLTRVFT
jgi:hypothetical protein